MTIPRGKKHELPSFLHQPQGMGGIEWAGTSGVHPTYYAILYFWAEKGAGEAEGEKQPPGWF